MSNTRSVESLTAAEVASVEAAARRHAQFVLTLETAGGTREQAVRITCTSIVRGAPSRRRPARVA